MNSIEARAAVAEWMDDGRPRDGFRIAIASFSKQASGFFNRNGHGDYVGPVLVEMELKTRTDHNGLLGIYWVDQFGIWTWDGDEEIDGAIWRQHLIPWSEILWITVHQAS